MSYIGNKPPYVTSGAIVDGTVQQIDLDAALNAKLDSINGTTTRYNYVATAGQTTFSATYTSGSVDVFLNGLKLDPADYTATNGNTIVLGVAASANDIVNIIANYSVPTSGPEASGVTNRYSFNATAGQTTFSAAYTPGNVDVYVNGLRLDVSDFVATNGTTVVLNAAAALNDIVNIVANGTIVIGDAYTQTQVNSLVATKQDALVSGTTIKTIGGQSILGSGDITVGGGSGAQTLAGTTTLTATSPTVNVLNISTYGSYIKLPDANTMSVGSSKFVIDNTSGYAPVGVLNGSNQVLGQIWNGDSVQFHLVDSTTVSGDWRHSGNLDPIWIDNEINFNAAYGDIVYKAVDETTSVVYWTDIKTGFPKARVVQWVGTGTTPTLGSEILLTSASTSPVYFRKIGGRVLIAFNNNTVVLVDISTDSVGAVVSVPPTGGSNFLNDIVVLDSQYAVLFNNNTALNMYQARCLDCGTTGTSVTLGATANAPAWLSSPQYDSTGGSFFKLTGTTIGVFAFDSNGTGYIPYAFKLTRTTGTTITFSSAIGLPTMFAVEYNQATICYPQTDATKVFYMYRGTNDIARYSILDYSGATPVWGTSVSSGILNAWSSQSYRIATSLNKQKILMTVMTASSMTGANIEIVSVSGTSVSVGSSQTLGETGSSFSSFNSHISDDGRGIVCWRGYGSTLNNMIRTFSSSGTAITLGTAINSSNVGSGGRPNYASGVTASVPGINGYCQSNNFIIRYDSNNTESYQSIGTVIKVNADGTHDIVTEFYPDATGIASELYNGNQNILVSRNNQQFGGASENYVMNLTTKKLKRGRTQAYRVQGGSIIVGKTVWSKEQMLLSISAANFVKIGSNVVLQTFRPAEV